MTINNKMGKWKTITVLQLFIFNLLVISVVLIPICTLQPLWVKKTLQVGNPVELREKHNYFSNLTEIAVETDYLYLLYGEYGVIEVYTTDGVYQRAYTFPSQRSGTAQLHRSNEGIWLESKDNTLYLFQDGTYQKRITGLAALDQSDLHDGPVERTNEKGYSFQTSFLGVTVIRKSAAGDKTVVLRRPFYDAFASRISLYFLPLLLFLPIFINLTNKWRENTSNRTHGSRTHGDGPFV